MEVMKEQSIFSGIEKKEIANINLENARDVLKRGLKFFVGEDAQWVQEYDDIADWLTDNKHKGLFMLRQVWSW